LQVPLAGRVENLVGTYTHFVADPAKLAAALAPFAAWHGQRRIDTWNDLAAAGRWDEFVADLLKLHYDPRYTASARKSFPNVTTPAELPDTSAESLDRLAAQLLAAG
jgi:tRNA 2-selenouridine synthase